MRIGGAASLKHLPDIAQCGEVPASHAVGNEVAAIRFAAQGGHLYPVVEDQIAGVGQGDRIIVGKGRAALRQTYSRSTDKTAVLPRRSSRLGRAC